MEQFEGIRRDHRVDGLSIRELAKKYRVHRRTVRQALAEAVPPARKEQVRERPVAGQWEPLVRGWLAADASAPRKQRHTAARVWQRLVDEHDAQISPSTVRDLVARLRVDLGQRQVEVMVPQTHLPGAEAEVDFGEVSVYLAGELVRVHMFVMRLSFSAKAVHRAYGTCASEAFLDGHVRAFTAFGGVPGRIRYDNLTPAVTKVLIGRERLENQRFVALRSHYGFDSFFCIPGSDGAHEKGGVEGEIGRFRRAHMTPVPVVADLAALNAAMAAADRRDDARHVNGRRETIGQSFAEEAGQLARLPDSVFDPVTVVTARVDTKARVAVRACHYSVPARLVGRRVLVRIGGLQIQIQDQGKTVATHSRAIGRGQDVLDLDHYLEVLVRKPGALTGATALAQARAAKVFTAEHQRFWDAARTSTGSDAAGTKALIGVLLLHRTMSFESVIAGIQAALLVGSTDPDVVAVEARRHGEARDIEPLAPTGTDNIIDIAWHRPEPSLTAYDNLLTNRDPQ